jgi:hypothetical protein
VSDHSFERFIQTAKIVLLSVILAVITVAYLSSPRTTTNAQLAMAAGFSYQNITTAGNFLLKGAPGTFHTLVINSPGATATSINIVDTAVAACTGGTVIATIPTADLPAAMVPDTLAFDLQFANGLCVQNAGTTPPNITVNWR